MEHSALVFFQRRIDALTRRSFPLAVHYALEPGDPPGSQRAVLLDSPRLSICLSGVGSYVVRRGNQLTEVIVKPGEIIYAAPRCLMESTPNARYLSLGVVYSTELTRFLLGRKVPATRGSSGHNFVEVFHTSRTLGDEGRHLHALIGEGTRQPHDRYLCRLVEALLLRSRELLDGTDAVPAGNKAQFRWQAACKFIEDHLQEPIGREDVARLLRLHPNHVSRLFVQRGGESFKARVTRLRLERARELLRDPALNIAEVAHACGFQDANYFTRCFHKVMGRTPGRDRQLKRR